MSQSLNEEPTKAQVVVGSVAAAVTVAAFVAIAVPLLLLQALLEGRK